ncbi:GSCOCG00000281001-RA-CDS [Cotesia congregata]|nr:GSCOCG00000281001-RA-CDS [Cotesia congregata]
MRRHNSRKMFHLILLYRRFWLLDPVRIQSPIILCLNSCPLINFHILCLASIS